GSGDTFYEDFFCLAVDKFGEAFEQTGAVKGADNVHINLEPDQDDITKLDAFAKQLVEKAAQD
ncbi:MAG: flavodoxin, partial [Limosilactobacillus mucosae]